MISALDVYLVMQLDALRGALFGFGLPAVAGGIIAAIVCACEARSQWSWDKEPLEDRVARFAGYGSTAKKAAIAGVFGVLLSAALPSSKTAAAMILVPALTSKEVIEPVGREAAELYALAKEALRNVADRKPEREPAKD